MISVTKIQAVVFKLGSGFVLARDEINTSYLIWHTNFSPVGLYGISDCRIGTVVNLVPIEGPKGMRGIECDVVRR